MLAKPLDIIVGQPTTKSMDRMTEQMAQMVAPVKTTAWGGLHGSLALVLDDADYAIGRHLNDQTTQCKLLRLQAETKKLQVAFDLQEAVTNIGVQRIIDNVEDQYVEELNGDYFGYANQAIKSVLAHLRTKWCKVMTKERTDATDAFYHTWVPSTIANSQNLKRSVAPSTSSSLTRQKRYILSDKCTRVTISPRSK